MTDSTTESTTDSARDQAPTDKYFDALLASYDALAHAIEQANERGLRISRQLLTDVNAAQRQALDLAKQVAANPNDTAAAYSAIMESAVAAQSQALDFTQSAYKEAIAAGSEGRDALDALLSTSRAAAEAALAIAREWQSSNPWADFLQKSMNAFRPSNSGSSHVSDNGSKKQTAEAKA